MASRWPQATLWWSRTDVVPPNGSPAGQLCSWYSPRHGGQCEQSGGTPGMKSMTTDVPSRCQPASPYMVLSLL